MKRRPERSSTLGRGMAWRSLSVAALVITAMISSVSAQPSKRVFPERVEVEKDKLQFNGQGLCEYGIFGIDLYWGALYLEKPSKFPLDVIRSKQKKRIHLHFVRALTKEQLRKAFTAAVEYNTKKRVGAYRASLAQLCKMMIDVKVKDDLVFDYVPEKGLRVSFTSRPKRSVVKGWIKDDAFCRLFFRLYFGKHPPDENLKRGMLTKRERD